jgi:hypothetical protein
MPFGSFVDQFPPLLFLVIHAVLFVIGAYLAWRSFGAGVPTAGWGFSLFAIAEIVYMTYHLNWTTFLFAHTIAEVLDLLAFVLLFVAFSRVVTGLRRT